MLLDNETVVRKYPDWITDRNPANDELEDQREYFGCYRGSFLVSVRGNIAIYDFFRTSRGRSRWTGNTKSVDGWMPLPKPVGK